MKTDFFLVGGGEVGGGGSETAPFDNGRPSANFAAAIGDVH